LPTPRTTGAISRRKSAALSTQSLKRFVDPAK
jgi:hypothetical protein